MAGVATKERTEESSKDRIWVDSQGLVLILVAVVLVKQVPIARHHQCFPLLVESAEPRTSLVLMCITQQAAVAQVEPRVTGLQAAQAAVETAPLPPRLPLTSNPWKQP